LLQVLILSSVIFFSFIIYFIFFLFQADETHESTINHLTDKKSSYDVKAPEP